MISFENDYIAGAHPEILKRLAETNMEHLPGYGTDPYCASAKEKIRKMIGLPDAEVEFLVGGTQTNAVIISSMLRDYEGVIAAKTGHINTHEAGAVEYTGHKVLVPEETEGAGSDEMCGMSAEKGAARRNEGSAAKNTGRNTGRKAGRNAGKLTAEAVERYLRDFYADRTCEHMVFPGMVYISHPTEYGTLYGREELIKLRDVCRAYSIPLFIDGARLGYGLASRETDVTLKDIAELCDVFYIGGTKVGALCGEAVVFTKGNRPAHFMTSVKKRGALLAKGRLLGVQFDTLFTDDLYFRISRHAIDMAEKMKEIFSAHGFELYIDSPTNQLFVIMENGLMERLSERIGFSFWEKADEGHSVVRFASSWSTTEGNLKVLAGALES